MDGLKTMTATELASRPLMVIFGEMFSPSQVWAGGKSRKSMLTSIGPRLLTSVR